MLEHGQGGLLLLEGGLCILNGHLSRLEGDVLVHEGVGEGGDGCLRALELSLLALELGLLGLKRRVLLLQRGRLRLGLLGLLLCRGSLSIAPAMGLGKLLLRERSRASRSDTRVLASPICVRRWALSCSS